MRAIAEDLGVGLSTLGKWVSSTKEADLLSGPHEDTARELARLCKENEILRQERDLLKKGGRLLCQGDHEMRFKVIEAEKANVPVQRACALLDVSESGFYAWKGRAPCLRQREDMVLLAHIRAEFRTSNETYGSPRMTAELNEDGIAVGRHRVARLMRDTLHFFPVSPPSACMTARQRKGASPKSISCARACSRIWMPSCPGVRVALTGHRRDSFCPC